MYENYQDLAVEAHEREPLVTDFGYFSGGSFVLDDVRMFSWFRSVEAMLEHLLEVEPRIYDLGTGEEIKAFQASLRPVLDEIRATGLSEAARSALNAVVKDYFVVEWWGSFESLASGEQDFARELRSDFREDEDESHSITSAEMEDFIEFLRNYGF